MAGTITGRVESGHDPAVVRRRAAAPLAAAAAAGLIALLVVGGVDTVVGMLPVLLAPVAVVLARLVVLAVTRPPQDRDDVSPSGYRTRTCTFVVTPPAGDVVRCVLRGVLRGEPPRRGESFEVYGRPRHDGTVRVREAVRLPDQAVIRAHPDLPTVLAVVADAAALLIVLACAAGLLASGIGGT